MSLQNTVSTMISVDPSKSYIVITENELLKEILPKNILVLPEKYTDLNLALNLQVMPEERSAIEDWLLRKVLNVPIPNDVVSFHGDKVALAGRILVPAEVNQLRSEIKVLQKMKLWNIISASVVDVSKKMMFENSRSYEDMRAGKVILYTLDLQNNILKNVAKETLDEKMKKIVQSKRQSN